MTPRDFYDQVVLPNIADFQSDPSDLRKAFNAVASIDALAAHLFYWLTANQPGATNQRDDSSFRQELSALSNEFGLLRDIAKAQKHVILTRHTPSVSSAAQIGQRSLGWGEGPWGEGPWGGGPVVCVQLDDGSLRVVNVVAAHAATFLDAELTRYGL